MSEEEIIILEEDDEEQEDVNPLETFIQEEDSEDKEEESPPLIEKIGKNRKKFALGVSLGALIIILSIVGLVWLIKETKEEITLAPIDTKKIAQELEDKTPTQSFAPSALETMLKKANLLYEQGNKLDALKIYENIAVFNEALSEYNIGVALMKEKNYKDALVSFKKAIENKENRTISSINAAVCALELGNMDLFKYYIDLSEAYLPLESNSPLYSYYVGLIHYYNDRYIEALAAFLHPTSEHYLDRQNYLSSKILSFLNSNHQAIDLLPNESINLLSLGLLNARTGELELAKTALKKAKEMGELKEKATIALSLVEAKKGNLQTTASLLKEGLKEYPDSFMENYSLKTTLKSSLFEINEAQKDFSDRDFFEKEKRYDLLFYFAPYQFFDAKQNIDTIRKGTLAVDLESPNDGLAILKRSTTLSKANISISEGIEKALNHEVYEANQIFLKALKSHPKHSILHYNLGLTYAQLGNYTLANKHFTSSYRLNPKNYLAGVFALMSLDLISKPIDKFKEDLKETIDSDPTLGEDNLYKAFIHVIENNIVSAIRWTESEKEETPLNIMFSMIIAKLSHNQNAYLLNAKILQKTLPKDLVSNILAFHALYSENEIKTYAKAIQIDFRRLDLDKNAFYFGPKVAKEHYIKILQIGGLLHHERESLMKKVSLENKNLPQMMETLAYLNIYTHNFEEAYTIYNQLIDEHKIQDSRTLFLAAVASVGSNHPENAIALLELSKLTDENNLESRYALGLLYLEVDNYNGAAIQFQKIGDSGFESSYFDFEMLN